jgi:hypothetical protein
MRSDPEHASRRETRALVNDLDVAQSADSHIAYAERRGIRQLTSGFKRRETNRILIMPAA